MLLVLVLDLYVVVEIKVFTSKYNYHYRINQEYAIINNFLTGALDFINNDTLIKLLENKFTDLTEPLSTLLERGYCYLEPGGEEKLFTELFINFKKFTAKRPLKFVICPTYICNLKCVYCFEKDIASGSAKFMPQTVLDSAFKSISAILEQYKRDSGGIELFGGEPLLKRTRNIVSDVISFAQNLDTKVDIITNGVMAGDFLDIFLPFKDIIQMLQITLDGPEQVHDRRRKFFNGKGSFKNIINSIDALVKNGINTNVRVNIDLDNINSLPDLYSFIIKMRWPEHKNFKIQPSRVTDHTVLEHEYPLSTDKVLLEKLLLIYERNPNIEKIFGYHVFKPLRHILDILHGAENVSPRFFNCESNLVEMFIFCPDGLIYTCPESIGIADKAIGSFYPELVFFNDRIKCWKDRDISVMGKCSSCGFAPLCGGGCPYSSMQIYKDCMQPVCEDFQGVLDTFFNYRGKQILEKYIQ